MELSKTTSKKIIALRGLAALFASGAVYAPEASVDLSGATHTSQCSAVVVKKLKMSGGGVLISN
jgi:hypothetical protein